jgi:hypothetical protein
MAAARNEGRRWAAALAAGALLSAGCSDSFEPEPDPFIGPTGPQEPLPAWTPPACERNLQAGPPPDAEATVALAWGMSAHWRGRAASTSFLGTEHYLVDVTFEPTGHYKAHSLMEGHKAFYYGEDDDVPEKTWELEFFSGSNPLGGNGRITIWFGPGNTQVGSLDRVMVSEDLSALRFRFQPTWLEVEPIQYELRCEP